ncbi:MAG: GNAT family N-acetyltransferase [Chitinophagaceae bacterium]|jgi:GNAT superfamily N-acetyltransferase|nr:GNAT family N-acetyltransferase [Chitinophagaceae bacterium]
MSLAGMNTEWQSKRLELDTEIKPFKSEDEDLNNFLKNDAKNYLKQRLAVTYLIENNKETLAYFCLSNDIILRLFADKDAWKKIKKTMPNAKLRSIYPAVKIGRLAVAKDYARRGFGKLILQTVREMYSSQTQPSGCRFLTVDAYQNAIPFYQRHLFNFLTSEDENEKTRLMYYDLQAIE